jgi:hypothetical protein
MIRIIGGLADADVSSISTSGDLGLNTRVSVSRFWASSPPVPGQFTFLISRIFASTHLRSPLAPSSVNLPPYSLQLPARGAQLLHDWSAARDY